MVSWTLFDIEMIGRSSEFQRFWPIGVECVENVEDLQHMRVKMGEERGRLECGEMKGLNSLEFYKLWNMK